MKYPPLLLDIMLDGRFLCQMSYKGNPMPILVNGDVMPLYDTEEIQKYVYQERPSLKGKNINIRFSTKKTFRK